MQVPAEKGARTRISLDTYRQRQKAKAPELPIDKSRLPELIHIRPRMVQHARQALQKDTEVSGSGVQKNSCREDTNGYIQALGHAQKQNGTSQRAHRQQGSDRKQVDTDKEKQRSRVTVPAVGNGALLGRDQDVNI